MNNNKGHIKEISDSTRELEKVDVEQEFKEVNKKIKGLETKIDKLTAYLVGDLDSPGKLGLYVRVHRHDERLDTVEEVVSDNRDDIQEVKRWRDKITNRGVGIGIGLSLGSAGVGAGVATIISRILGG